MNSEIGEIWDMPVEEASTRPAPNDEPLFIHASDDEDDAMPDAPARRPADPAPDMNAIFSAVDSITDDPGDNSRPPALTPHQILSSSPAHHLNDEDEAKDGKDGAKPKKKKAMRLDEGRLIECFPQLIQDTKKIKIKGKGHEAGDLNRLLQVYQFWTHRLYPKTPFKDTVDRVEKLCHSRRMHNQLSQWRDEAHGISPEGDEQNDKADAPPNSAHGDDAASSSHEAPPSLPPSSDVDGDARPSSPEEPEINEDDQAAMDVMARRNARQVSMAKRHDPPSDQGDADIPRVEGSVSQPSTSTQAPAMVDDDSEFWDKVKDTVLQSNNLVKDTVSQSNTREDDDWAMLDEMQP
ncbi:chromosome segregation in meiosis protein [Favolaschia claudopus]|uniref:Chromosome segregation in meiosis protein n=1 Tax=Favolaschia claudopus TaxID=2862362 RepID=A0AAW0B5T2_9AGAR